MSELADPIDVVVFNPPSCIVNRADLVSWAWDDPDEGMWGTWTGTVKLRDGSTRQVDGSRIMPGDDTGVRGSAPSAWGDDREPCRVISLDLRRRARASGG